MVDGVKINRKAKWRKEWERVELKGVLNAKRDNTFSQFTAKEVRDSEEAGDT